MQQDNSIILRMYNITKHFNLKAGIFSNSAKKVYALNGADIELRKGQTLGIVGESGCGKTTLARCILGVLKPDTAETVKAPGKNRIQYIFQDPYLSLNPKMQIKDIITEPMVAAGMISRQDIRKEAERLLELVGLPADSADKFPHEFSGGQRQRICIGRAVSSRPDFIICDEPVSSLDVSIQSQILNLLNDIQKELGMSYIFIAHNIAVVLYMSDTVSVMYAGRIVESAPPEELYKNPKHPYTKLLLSVVPEIGKNKRIFEKKGTGEIPGLTELPSGCPFYERCPVRSAECAEKIPELKEITPLHRCACHSA